MSFFDSIPHHELMKSIARRVTDGALLGLIKVWLEMSVEEDDGHGGKRRPSLAKDSGRGTPQGAPSGFRRRKGCTGRGSGREVPDMPRVLV
jgi:hypothetical protein